MKFSKCLQWTMMTLLFLFTGSSFAQKTLSTRINAADDDQEEWLPAGSGQTQGKTVGNLDAGSSDLEFGTESSGNDPQLVGLRFNNINIPKGAVILSAYIQFTVDATSKNNDPCVVYIKGENADSSLIFNPAVAFNISNRAKTADSVQWNVSGSSWGTVGSANVDQRTPNLKKVIEAIMARSGWKTGNPLTFFMYGKGTREVESYDGDAPKAPMLVITYLEPLTLNVRVNNADDDQEEWLPAKGGQTQSKTIGALDAGSSDLEFGTEASGNDPQMVGMRFNNISIPKGSLITRAYIQFTVDATAKNNSPCEIILKGEATDSAAMFNPNVNGNITSRNKTSDSVLWTVSGSTWGTVGAATEDQRTANIKSIIQGIVNRTGWKSGNSLAIFMHGSGTREVESYDGDAPKAPLLVIEYIPLKTMSIRVSAADDDQEEWIAAKGGQTQSKTVGNLDPGSSDLEFGTESTGNDPQMVGIRFRNITLPAGAIVENAYIQFTVDAISKNNDPCSVTIKGEANDTPSIFNPSVPFNITSRVKTTDSVNWSVSGSTWGTVGAATADQRTPNLKNIVENLVNRKSWVSGNPMAFFISGTGTREVESYDGDAPKAPLLVIDYLASEGGPAAKPRIPVTSYPIAKKSAWLYLDSGFNLATGWKDRIYKRDTTWYFGSGPLGFGELGFTGTEINGGPTTNRYITTYFRKPFIVSNLSTVSDTIELKLMADDGAVVYINGVEVVRRNVPTGTVNNKTKANVKSDEPFERLYWLYYLPKSVLRADSNEIAVEIHQIDSLSNDLLFDLALNNRKYKANPSASGCIGASSHIGCFTSIIPTEQTDTIAIPTSHKFQALLNTGMAYSKGGTVPSNFDYTGYMPIDGNSKKGYVSLNHEKNPGGVSILDVHYNCTNGRWVLDSVQPVDFGGELVKTAANCSGGNSPWGTIVTCEEDTPPGDANGDGYQDIGWMVEIDPAKRRVKEYGNGKREKLWAMGRMSHENICFKNDSLTSYFGEDEPDGQVYKFVADQKGNLSSGKLYALKLSTALDGAGDPTSTNASWVLIPNTTVAERNGVKAAALNAGATKFNGVEDVEINPLNGDIFFAVKGVGRTYRFTDNGTSVTNFKTFAGGEAYPINFGNGVISEDWGGGNDNLTFDDKGNLWVLQDGGRNFIWLLRPEHTQADPKVELFMTTPSGSEPTGMTFTPDYKYMFVSIQEPAANTAVQKDVNGTSVVFNKSYTLVIARKENFTATSITTPVITGLATPIQNSVQNYSVTKNAGSTYNWNITNGTQQSGGTTNAISVKWGLTSSGNVSVIENVNSQCVSAAGQLSVNLQVNDLENLNKIPGLKVFPNPTSQYINLSTETTVEYEVLDVTGQAIHKGSLPANDVAGIDLGNQASGLYFLHVFNSSEQITVRIIKK